MTPKPKRLGRPPRAGKASLVRVEIRLTAAEHQAWIAAATRESMSLSEWIRLAAECEIARG